MDNLNSNILKKFGKGKKKTLKKGGRAVIYQRVSSKPQEDGFSPETQVERCYEWAERNNYEVVKCFEGAHESAKTDTKRKRFNQMLTFVKDKKNKIDAVIVYNTSRFSRSGSFSVVEELQSRGINVFSATSSYDARTAIGEFSQGIELLHARYDNRTKAEGIIDNSRRALRSGRWIQKAPRGYDMITTKDEQIITVNKVGESIQKAFKMKVDENLTNEEVRVRMRSEGLDLKKQQWSKIFKNIFYAGYFSHNFLEGELIQGPHKPLVSLEDFMKINGMLSQAHSDGYEVKLEKEFAPLLGSLKCPVCGHNLTASLSTKMKKKYGKEVGYYVCSRTNCKCNGSTQKLNLKFEEWIDGVAIPQSLEEMLQSQLKRAFPILNKDGMEEVKAIRANLTNKNKEIEQIEENLATAKNPKDKEVCRKVLDKMEAEREEILSQLEERDKSILNLNGYVNYGLSIRDNMLKLWKLGNLYQKKRIQNLIFPDGLVYNKENDDIEPINKNEFIFIFDLKSTNCADKKRKTNHQNDDLSPLVLEAGLEPAQPSLAKGF